MISSANRFLDLHLKNKTWDVTLRSKPGNVVRIAAPVHFWSIGDERWLASETFPPEDLSEMDLIFDRTELDLDEMDIRKDSDSNQKIVHKVVEGGTALLRTLWENLLREIRQLAITSALTLKYCIHSTVRWSDPLSKVVQIFYSAIEEHWTGNTRGLDLGHGVLQEAAHSYRLVPRGTFNLNQSSSILFSVDYNASTRGLSRWVIAKHPFRMATNSHRELKPTKETPVSNGFLSTILRQFVHLPFWSSASGSSTGNLLMFTSSALSKSVRIAGSPVVRFSLNLTEELEKRAGDLKRAYFTTSRGLRINELLPIPALDVTVFGYLEDVDLSTGKVHYVTEGRIMLSHRFTIPDATILMSGLADWTGCVYPPAKTIVDTTFRQKVRIGSADIVFQSGDRSTHRFSVGKFSPDVTLVLFVGGVECVVFTFEPVSWYFQQGHAIRLSLAGADRANFHWSRTQSKEDTYLLDHSLISAVRAGEEKEKLTEIRRRGLHVQQPHTWNLPLDKAEHPALLKLPIL